MLKVLATLVLFGLISGCESSAQDSKGNALPEATAIGLHDGLKIRRFYDNEEDKVCYTYSRSISCTEKKTEVMLPNL